MTITTVKPYQPVPRPVAFAVATALLTLAPASHASWKFTPLIEVRETYTDNVSNAVEGVAQAQWVTTYAPGFTLAQTGPRLTTDITYSKQLYKYRDANVGGARDHEQRLAANAKAKLVDEWLFVDMDANIQQRSASAFGPLLSTTTGPTFASANAAEVKTLRISPYLAHRFGSLANVELRYGRDRVASEVIGFSRSDSDNVTLNATSGAAFHTLGWSVQANHQQLTSQAIPAAGATTVASPEQKTGTDTATVALRYLYTPALTFTSNIGYDKYDYAALGGVSAGKSWSLGVNWVPGPHTTVAANAGKRYYGNSYYLNLQHRTRASVWIVNYNDAVTTTRQQFLLPSTIDTASMLDRMFAASIADPAARRQAVNAYMLATGLPPSLANNINYLSNRYMLQKQLQASAAFNTARTTTVFTLQSASRDALSNAQTDSTLLGPGNSTLNDNTRQRGGNVTLNWRLSSRTGFNMTADYSHIASLTTQRVDINRSLRLNLTRELQPTLRGTLEVRHVEGTAAAHTAYTENAVSASLNKQF